MELHELYNLIPESASVLAVIVVVILFLKHIKESAKELSDTMKTVSDTCHISHREARQDYQSQVNLIIESYKISSERQATATKDLENAVRQLTMTVSSLYNKQEIRR